MYRILRKTSFAVLALAGVSGSMLKTVYILVPLKLVADMENILDEIFDVMSHIV